MVHAIFLSFIGSGERNDYHKSWDSWLISIEMVYSLLMSCVSKVILREMLYLWI